MFNVFNVKIIIIILLIYLMASFKALRGTFYTTDQKKKAKEDKGKTININVNERTWHI